MITYDVEQESNDAAAALVGHIAPKQSTVRRVQATNGEAGIGDDIMWVFPSRQEGVPVVNPLVAPDGRVGGVQARQGHIAGHGEDLGGRG